jgi:hypothetical protein
VRLLIKYFSLLPVAGTLLIGAATFASRTIDPPSPELPSPELDASRQVMLILRGIANAENPRGQLDDEAALAYAGRRGFKGEVLDTAGDTHAGSPQVEKALERIRTDRAIAAIYGFSGGGYNARLIWKKLEPTEHARIRQIVVIGSPGVSKSDFPGSAEVLIKADPPEGHLAGPRRLLESLDAEGWSTQ